MFCQATVDRRAASRVCVQNFFEDSAMHSVQTVERTDMARVVVVSLRIVGDIELHVVPRVFHCMP